MTKVVDNLYYTENDEWVKVEGDTATIGITDYAQDSLSDIVFLELPDVGAQLKKGDSFGVVESVKAAADLYMPLDGEIIESNESLLDEPEKINDSPYDDAWMIKVNIDDKSQLEDLMSADAYRDYRDAE